MKPSWITMEIQAQVTAFNLLMSQRLFQGEQLTWQDIAKGYVQAVNKVVGAERAIEYNDWAVEETNKSGLRDISEMGFRMMGFNVSLDEYLEYVDELLGKHKPISLAEQQEINELNRLYNL